MPRTTKTIRFVAVHAKLKQVTLMGGMAFVERVQLELQNLKWAADENLVWKCAVKRVTEFINNPNEKFIYVKSTLLLALYNCQWN
jgi:hypothetical protein